MKCVSIKTDNYARHEFLCKIQSSKLLDVDIQWALAIYLINVICSKVSSMVKAIDDKKYFQFIKQFT